MGLAAGAALGRLAVGLWWAGWRWVGILAEVGAGRIGVGC